MTRNMAASVRQRLLNLSRETGERFQNLLTRYGIERLVYRLTQSGHSADFILNNGSDSFEAREAPAQLKKWGSLW